MKFPYAVGQRFKNTDDYLEVTDITRYRVYYEITLSRGGMAYSAAYNFDTFPVTYIKGMLGKSEFLKAVAGNGFKETDRDWRPMRPADARWIPSPKSSWGEA